jgi:hypothetical protein
MPRPRLRKLCMGWLAAPLLLGACAGIPQQIGTEAVTDAYSAGGGRFDDGASVILLIRTFEQDDRVAYCGVRTGQGPTGRTLLLNDLVPGAAVLYLAGDRIHQGFDPLPEARYRDNMTGATARCFVTDREWRPDYADAAPVLRIARMQFDTDEESGDVVIFRQEPVFRPLPGPAPEFRH